MFAGPAGSIDVDAMLGRKLQILEVENRSRPNLLRNPIKMCRILVETDCTWSQRRRIIRSGVSGETERLFLLLVLSLSRFVMEAALPRVVGFRR